MKRLKEAESEITHVPFSLFPNSFSQREFLRAVELAPLFNTLVDKIACDQDWLLETLQPVFVNDPFTARLAQLFKDSPIQKIRLGIHRSDYMLHLDGKILQVELNTIASSFGCISALTSLLHQSMLNEFLDMKLNPQSRTVILEMLANIGALPNITSFPDSAGFNLPENSRCCENLASAISIAHSEYQKYCLVMDDDKDIQRNQSVVIFVVQNHEGNIFDQFLLQESLVDKHQIQIRRMTLAEIAKHAIIDNATGKLFISLEDGNNVEVSVIYFRAGYTPTDYPSEDEWEGRRKIEAAWRCVKCPTLGYQLAGSKIVQQRLSDEGEVERFLTSSASLKVRSCFTELYSLSPSTRRTSEHLGSLISRVIEEPNDWILKPQREGGGNNIYDSCLSQTLQNGNATELASLVLMKKIKPVSQQALLVEAGQVKVTDTVNELGVFGTYLVVDSSSPTQEKETSRVVLNEHAGHLLRVKPSSMREGGVATGYAVLSSPVLIK